MCLKQVHFLYLLMGVNNGEFYYAISLIHFMGRDYSHFSNLGEVLDDAGNGVITQKS